MAEDAGAAPRERLDLSLRELYKLPDEPLYLTNKQATRILLEMGGQDPDSWFNDFWEEYEKNESLLVHELGLGKTIKRYIRTAVVRITRHKRYRGTVAGPSELKSTVEWLVEFIVEPDGTLRLRPFQNSLSGKLTWSERRAEKALLREIREELALPELSARQLGKSLVLVPPKVTYWKDTQSGCATELDEHPSHKYPGVRTHNQLFNYMWRMPERYWRDVYVEQLKGGRLLVHIWAPTETRYNSEHMLEYIRAYMQHLIVRRLRPFAIVL